MIACIIELLPFLNVFKCPRSSSFAILESECVKGRVRVGLSLTIYEIVKIRKFWCG